jgi:uncharacterized repeat protein (TIGR03803 family)
LRKLSLSKMACIVFVFCAVMAIASYAQTLTTLVTFDATNGDDPQAPVIQGSDGNFYGTTFFAGPNEGGTVFKMTPSGGLTTLYGFCSQPNCTDGLGPLGALVQGTDGNFYGTTSEGGANGQYGTVFKVTPSGSFTRLYSFCSHNGCADGANPNAALVLGTDGNFYGTTLTGGTTGSNDGTIFKITPSGTLTTLYSFCAQGGCPDGAQPYAGLVQATDGNFYGTTFEGGANQGCAGGCGTLFKITSNGTLTKLHDFCSQQGCADGYNPQAGLVQATDGNLYGTTTQSLEGGPTGTVFKITTTGTLTPIYQFCSQPGCADGYTPVAGLVQATDGNLYGTTEFGGLGGDGTIFKITPGGALTTLHNFDGSDGNQIVAGLVQAIDGSFYGTTSHGGSSGDGTVYQLGVALSPPAAQFVPVAPCRLVDTRPSNGGSGPIQGGTFEVFNLPQLAQTKGCADLTLAATYSLNVTLVPVNGAPVSYLTIWPSGKNKPLVSTMNSLDGRIKANAAIVPAGASGAVNVYVTNTTNVVLDIDGYFAPPTGSTLAFYPLTPCRVLDTRKGNGPLGGPFLNGGQERDFPVLESDCQIPSSAQAYSMNFTVVPYSGQPLGYLTVWPQGSPKPVVSTLNNLTATIVANAAIVPAGTGGGIATYPDQNTQLVADIDGYFAAAGQGGLSLYPVVPCRVIDTRQGNGAFTGELTVNVVGSLCAPPSNAQGYVFNATVVPLGSLGYLTLWPDSEHQPVVSTLNAIDGAVTSNMAIVPNINGSTDAFASGITQLILDISSYFAP